MKEQLFGTLKGLKVPILVYESYVEGDAVGGPNALLDQANGNLAYRGPLAEAREIVCDLLESETGISRKTKTITKGGKEVTVFDESEGEYANRVCAEKKWDDLSGYQEKITSACRSRKVKNEDGTEVVEPLAVDVTERERKAPVSAKLAQKYKDTAAKVLAANNVDKFNERFGAKIGKKFVVSGDLVKDTEDLGRLVKDYATWKEAQDKLAMDSELVG